jgi:hypothetical protein
MQHSGDVQGESGWYRISNLQGVQRGLGGSSLLLLAVAREGIILLPKCGHIANAGVGSQRTEPCSHWHLQVE